MNWKLTLIIFFIVIILGFLACLFYYSSQVRNFPTQNQNTVDFEIEKGESFVAIVNNLSDENIIQNPLIFKLYLFISGDAKKLQAGTYEIDSGSTIKELVIKFVDGDVSENKLIVLEGWRLSQIEDEIVEKCFATDTEFSDAIELEYSILKEFKELDSKFSGESIEGFIFPDTYKFTKDVSISDIVKTTLENFKEQTSNFKLLQVSTLSPYEVLVLASIVEREVESFNDRKLVAAVFLNRLRSNMKLQADPTVQYGKGRKWPEITRDDYKNVDSVYSTYKNFGLPPTPICSPSLSSIKAVISAPQTSYYYFFNTDDGSTIFSETNEEHLEKQRKSN